MAGEIRREESSYRRGLVMGLTMAEVMVLIVFCLLLLLGGSIVTRSEAENVTRLVELRPALMEAAGYGINEPIPDDFVELVRAGRAVREGLEASHLATDAAAIEQIIRLGAEARNELGANTMSKDATGAAEEFIRQAAAAYGKAKRVRPQGSSSIWLESELKAAESCNGRGAVLPPCARTADGRSAQVFTATLATSTITLHDNRIPELEAARQTWPLESIRFDQPLEDAAFLEQTRAMYDWSVARGCRFVVRIADETGPAEKLSYKLRLRTVEGHFYKDEPFPVR